MVRHFDGTVEVGDGALGDGGRIGDGHLRVAFDVLQISLKHDQTDTVRGWRYAAAVF
jgi:hypothetical protein